MRTFGKRPTEAWQPANAFKSGMGEVIIARFKSSGEVEAGVFLLDTFCLGVKNAFFTRLDEHEYEEELLAKAYPTGGKEVSPPCARKLVEDAVAYTRDLGLEPHADYKKACRVLGGIKAAECDETFTFGDNGKPHYIPGPHDSNLLVQRVLRTLTSRLGPKGFRYTVLGRCS